MPMVLTQQELDAIAGLGERLTSPRSPTYLPPRASSTLGSRRRQRLYAATSTFLGELQTARQVPFVIGIAGSVAVGKSTTARLLATLLARWDSHPKVDLVTTDGFPSTRREPQAPRHPAPKGISSPTTAEVCCALSPR